MPMVQTGAGRAGYQAEIEKAARQSLHWLPNPGGFQGHLLLVHSSTGHNGCGRPLHTRATGRLSALPLGTDLRAASA